MHVWSLGYSADGALRTGHRFAGICVSLDSVVVITEDTHELRCDAPTTATTRAL